MSSPRAIAAFSLAAAYFGYVFMQRVAPSAIVDDLMRDFAVGGAIVGQLSAYYLYAYASLQIPIGLISDRIGVRRLLALSAALCGIGGLVFALAPGLGLVSVGRFMVGLGAASAWIGVLTVAAQELPAARFALFSGVAQTVGMAGGVFGQAPIAAAALAFGWRASMVAVALIAIAMAVGMWLLVRDPPPRAARTHVAHDLVQLLGRAQNWFAAGFGLAVTGAMLGYGGLWAVPFLTSTYGLSRPGAAATASLVFAGWGIACPFIGWLSDRLGRRCLPMTIGAVIATATMAMIAYVPNLPLPAIWALHLIHGAAASTMVLSFPFAREHNPAHAGGLAMAFVNTAVVGSGALMQPLIGWLLDLNWDGAMAAGARVYSPGAYRVAFTALVIAAGGGIALSLLMRETNCRPVYQARMAGS